MQGLLAPLSRDDDRLVADDLSYRPFIVPWQGMVLRPSEQLRNEGDDAEAAAASLEAF